MKLKENLLRNALNFSYPGDDAFNVADLDEDDISALSAQYSMLIFNLNMLRI